MNRYIKKIFTFLSAICIGTVMQGQSHYNAWFRSTFKFAAGEKFEVDAEVQHRRQNGYANTWLLNKNLLLSYRNWIHYKHNRNIVLSLSPFARFAHYKTGQHQANQTGGPANETRFSGAFTIRYSILNKVFAAYRTAVAYRIFENKQPRIVRVRNRLGFRIPVNSHLDIGIYNELLLNVSGTNMAHFYDQHRIGVNLNYRVFSNLKTDMGYMNISRLPPADDKMVHEHIIYLNMTLQWSSKKNGTTTS